MKRSQKLIIGLLAIAALCLSGLVVILAMQTYQSWALQPLGPRLSNSTPYAAWALPATWTASPFVAATSVTPLATPIPGLTALPIEALNPQMAPALAPQCGGPDVMHILMIGSDQRSDSYIYGLGDVIRLVRVDFRAPRVSVLEFPRDLWVEIPDIADDLHGQDHEKLNQAYLYGNRGFGYTDDPAQGPGLLARTLALNFGTQLDHYVGVNMRTFVKVVNAVDGIDVYLPKGMDGRTDEDRSKRLLFPPGVNHLNGDEALTLARIRNDGVFSRADNQDLVLCSLREKLLRPTVVTRLPELIGSFQDNIQTDLSPAQVSQLACLGTGLRPGNIVFASFPQEYFTGTRIYDPVFGKRVFIWDVDFEVLRDYVRRFQAGTWPAPGLPAQDAGSKEPVIVCQ
jgi:LCP family protein required for cell wall assembly